MLCLFLFAGYCFLLFQDEMSVQALIEACIVDDDKLYWCVSSPTMKDKPVSISRCTFIQFSEKSAKDTFHRDCLISTKAFFQNASLITMSGFEIEMVIAKFLLTELYPQLF